MGFTAIQISPVVHNIENDTIVGDAYHGYYQDDLYALNEHFGTHDELVKLSDELHARDMYLLVDVVVNNMAQAFDNTLPPKVDYAEFEPFNNQDYFHSYCNVTDWTNATDYQDCWLYPLGVALADLRTEDDAIVTMFSEWIKELVSNFTIDGVRIDAAKHVNNAFLPAFVADSGVFALGEVLTGEVTDFCPYQTNGYLSGILTTSTTTRSSTLSTAAPWPISMPSARRRVRLATTPPRWARSSRTTICLALPPTTVTSSWLRTLWLTPLSPTVSL